MVRNIKFHRYRKFGQDLEIFFCPGVNIISGVNGTCKTSLLHIISNAYKRPTQNTRLLSPSKRKLFLEVFSKTVKEINPKIESLTKGDKVYNDPAIGHRGFLFEVGYFDHPRIRFRRHVSQLETKRYSVKPQYKRNSGEKLPDLPVVYLGLFRIFPVGEYVEENNLSAADVNMPEEYRNEIRRLYLELTALEISEINIQQMGHIKKRGDFKTKNPGVDSNTISAGEDNLYIILTALVMLHYYYETLAEPQREVESVLLIDELDATLHPSVQIKLLHKLAEYAAAYKIQIVFTTHSLTILEEALLRSEKFSYLKARNGGKTCTPKVIYLKSDASSIELMQQPDVKQIKMHLNNLSRADLFPVREIPIIVEDSEAQKVVAWILDYFASCNDNFRNNIQNTLKIIPLRIGCESLKTVFQTPDLSLPMFLILDGDAKVDNTNILKLPGAESPEEYLYNYAKSLYDMEETSFWREQRTKINFPTGKNFFRERIMCRFEDVQEELEIRLKNSGTIKGKKREKLKQIFKDELSFFETLFYYWVRQPENQSFLNKFYEKMRKRFVVISRDYGIDPAAWPKLPNNNE